MRGDLGIKSTLLLESEVNLFMKRFTHKKSIVKNGSPKNKSKGLALNKHSHNLKSVEYEISTSELETSYFDSNRSSKVQST